MGRSVTPTYRVEISVAGSHWTPASWDSKRAGRPTDETLAAYVAGLEASTRAGGCNAHLGETTVRRASVIRQATGETVATYEQPAFTADLYEAGLDGTLWRIVDRNRVVVQDAIEADSDAMSILGDYRNAADTLDETLYPSRTFGLEHPVDHDEAGLTVPPLNTDHA